MAATRKPAIRTLRELRLEAGMTLPELAHLVSVPKGTLSNIERGRMVATDHELGALSNALGTRLENRMQAVEVRS